MGDVQSRATALRSALGAIGVGLLVSRLTTFAKSGIDVADSLAKQAQSAGTTVEGLQVYQRAAKFAGVETEQLNKSLAVLSRAALDVRAGTGVAGKAFERLGISVERADGSLKDTGELLEEIADAFAGMGDGLEKTGLAAQIFGTNLGAKLIPVLNAGSAGFRDARQELEQFGELISGETARQAEEFNDNITRLTGQVDRLRNALAADLLPALNRIVGVLVEGTRASGSLLEAFGLWLDLDASNLVGEVARLEEELLKLEATAGRIRSGESLEFTFFGLFDDAETNLRTARSRVAAARALLRKEQTDPGVPIRPGGPSDTGGAGATGTGTSAGSRERERQLQRETRAIADLFLAGEKGIEEYDKAWADSHTKMQEDLIESEAAIEKMIAAFHSDSDSLEAELDVIDKWRKEANKTGDVARELGLTFSSAFEDAIIAGGDLRDILKGIEADIIRIITRKLVTEPLGNLVSTIIGPLIPGAAEGVDFVPRDMPLFVHRGERVVPAAENAAGGGRSSVSIVMNIQTPDAGSFRASRGQIISDMSRALAAARRNL